MCVCVSVSVWTRARSIRVNNLIETVRFFCAYTIYHRERERASAREREREKLRPTTQASPGCSGIFRAYVGLNESHSNVVVDVATSLVFDRFFFGGARPCAFCPHWRERIERGRKIGHT